MNSTELPNLITLADGQSGLRSAITVEIREPSASEIANQKSKIENPDAAILDFVASDETLDRYDEIVSAAGWKLDSYRRNPVFQNAHKYGDIIFTLGKSLITEVRSLSALPSSLCLFQRVQFAVEINPMAKIAYGLYKGKFLNAVSVGFVPIRWEDFPSSSSSSSSSSSVPRRKYLEQELLEVSAVGIPANPNALALGLKSGAIEKSDIKDTLDLFRKALEESPEGAPENSPGLRRDAGRYPGNGPNKNMFPLPARHERGDGQGEGLVIPASNDQPLLTLARVLRDLMRRI
jgi:hypothetical protein